MADSDEEIRPRRKTKGKNKGKVKKRQSGSFPLSWFIAGGAGCVVLFLVWSLLPIMGGGWLAKGTPLDPAVRAKAAEEVQKAAEELQKDKEREKSVQVVIDSFVRRQGRSSHVTVVFENVRSDSDDVYNYLYQKVLKASWFDFKQELKREQAELLANIRKPSPQMAAGPPKMFPPPHILLASRRNSRIKLVVFSVLDLNQFVSRLELGENAKIDAGNRTVTLRLNLPNPLPEG